MKMRRVRRAFTAIDVVLVLVVLLVLLVILMPMMGGGQRGPARQMQNNTQIRSIHQGMVMYAQGNKSNFPGLGKEGEVVNMTVEHRFWILLDSNFFTGEYAISPVETKTEWTTDVVTTAHYSYAMLDADSGGERASEWKETLNTLAPAMSDRNTGRDVMSHVSSIHGRVDDGHWRGSVAWNDNHVEFETTHRLETKYGKGPEHADDNLFASDRDDDALMIYSGS